MEDTLNKTLVEQTLIFHGLPLIKTWNEEYGANSLSSMGIQATNIIDTSLYHARLKSISYTDRSKRMKLHNFICSKSSKLFKNFREDPSNKRIKKLVASGGDIIPPLEYYSNISRDERVSKFFSSIKLGDIVYGIVSQTTKVGLVIKLLCTVGSSTCLVSDLNLKGNVTHQNLISALDAQSISRPFMINDYVCCEVLNFGDQYPQLDLGMRGEHERYDNGPSLGLINYQQLPQFYKVAIEQQNQAKSYNQILKESEFYKNPAVIENLLIQSGLNHNTYYSFMSKSKYLQDEYAKDLRQQQASKLAFRAVAEGIAHFKEGRHTEAFQCLNKALQVDPRNVEGLVARGALFANSGSFNKAIVDFEAALKINPTHVNAKKYLGETLLALGRSYEEDGKFEEAQKAYIDCLNINPHHQEALASLNYIKTKINTRKIVEPAELELPPLHIGSIPPLKESKRDPYYDMKVKEDSRKKMKKERKKKGKKRHSSSSDSSSESSESSDSSSESSENSSSTSDSDSRSKKKDKKRKSLSPKRDSIDYYGQNFEIDDHELKVKKFLEMGRDEDDYEEKVGQLLAEASKYQKSKQAAREPDDGKQAKKKKKSEKKIKKEKKKRKKDDKKKTKGTEIEDLREALKMFENLPEKIKKLYQDKIKEEESSKHKDQSGQGSSAGIDDGKWKMKFSKDERQGDSKKATKAFSLYDSDDEEDLTRSFQSHSQATGFCGASSTVSDIKKSPMKDVGATSAPVVNKGPVVLDKFGNFRLAEPPQTVAKTTETTNRRSRSRRSRSRSDSRSPRRRRSSSYSKRRYSRSRSRSPNRNRGFGNRYDNNRSRQQRYSPNRGNNRGSTSRWNNNFRDNRDYRRQDRFRSGEKFRDNNSNRYNPRFLRRSMSRSPLRSPKGSPEKNDSRDKDDVKKTSSGTSLW